MSELTPKNNYAYWVSYHWKSASSTGFGGGRCFSTMKAGSLTWIEAARHWIEDQHSFQTVIIINWKRLKDDESWDRGAMTRTISDAMIRIDPILSEGWWMELRSPFIIGGDCWRCGLTQAGATGWNGSPDIEAAGETATEAIENVCDMWERRNEPILVPVKPRLTIADFKDVLIPDEEQR